MQYGHLLIFGSLVVTGWFLFILFWPRMLLFVFKSAILVRGFGEGPVPVNTLYTQPEKMFAEPITSQSLRDSELMTRGVNHDTLLSVGWLDLARGPQCLCVPDMTGRYYSVQFVDPSKNENFAYVGTRTTGTDAGEYVISGGRWKGSIPQGMTHIPSPSPSVLVIVRTLVENESDLSRAYALARQIQIRPLNLRQSE
ncbi:DUF1254 domain-containing protein [Terriglobus roseus]|uniref:DUF1254 domain-containing protein n=1 Tax=Terriglobus roseus TaxID=392734 RepID=A0A1G7JEE3_9BACT|nr:DUF1254 domain-containing protein [Terriglobus roseus]SDF23312.1 Protein of unknown function [Terriglobus roseus]